MIYATFVLFRANRSVAFQIEIPTFIVTDALAIASAFRMGFLASGVCPLEIEGVSTKKTRGVQTFPMSQIPFDIADMMRHDWEGK